MKHNQIHARLIERNSNFEQWAKDNGYNPRTVQQAVKRWAGVNGAPRGRLTFRILKELSEFIGQEIIEGVFEITEADLPKLAAITHIVKAADQAKNEGAQ